MPFWTSHFPLFPLGFASTSAAYIRPPQHRLTVFSFSKKPPTTTISSEEFNLHSLSLSKFVPPMSVSASPATTYQPSLPLLRRFRLLTAATFDTIYISRKQPAFFFSLRLFIPRLSLVNEWFPLLLKNFRRKPFSSVFS